MVLKQAHKAQQHTRSYRHEFMHNMQMCPVHRTARQLTQLYLQMA